jgi:hypothetical protein
MLTLWSMATVKQINTLVSLSVCLSVMENCDWKFKTSLMEMLGQRFWTWDTALEASSVCMGDIFHAVLNIYREGWIYFINEIWAILGF